MRKLAENVFTHVLKNDVEDLLCHNTFSQRNDFQQM